MKYIKKDYAKFNIDLSKCETYDDVVICTVEGNVNNGAPIDKHMFAQYCDIVEKDAINEFLNEAFNTGTVFNFSMVIVISQRLVLLSLRMVNRLRLRTAKL